MQDIIFYVAANTTLGTVRDYLNAKNLAAPTLVRGASANLKMRLFANQDGETAYPVSKINASAVASWSFVMDNDFDSATEYKVVADNGSIVVGTVSETINGTLHSYTQVTIPISDMSSAALAALIGTNESVTIHGELCGYDSSGDVVFILQVKGFTVRNRILAISQNSTDISAAAIAAMEDADIEFQYSANGSTDWHFTRTSADRYIRLRVEETDTWSDAIKITQEIDMPTKVDVWGHTELEPDYLVKPAVEYETDAAQEDTGYTYTRYLNREVTCVHRTHVEVVDGRERIINEVAYGAWENRANLTNYDSPDTFPKSVNVA